MELENVRQSYRPNRITVLFVGESPPQGGTFFYCGNSHLFSYTIEAFRCAFRPDVRDEHFLSMFMRAGCYLEDLSPTPINHLRKPDRRKARRAAVGQFRERVKAASPEAVVCVVKGIAKLVREAVNEAGFAAVLFEAVPFPAMGHEQKYIAELSPILRRLAADGRLGTVWGANNALEPAGRFKGHRMRPRLSASVEPPIAQSFGFGQRERRARNH